jgi:7,8-dihydropterin-6-yl-methyl-4-(beta-D-ribofuranosyl)aminobenzene 5'-phosphate synthase
VFDALLTGDERTTRPSFNTGRTPAPQFESGSTTVGMMAEHGFSALVSVRRGASTTTLVFDTGLSPDAMVTNASRLGTDLSHIQAVVLSHGHFDHRQWAGRAAESRDPVAAHGGAPDDLDPAAPAARPRARQAPAG